MFRIKEDIKLLTQNQIGVLYMVASVICFSIMDICVKWLDYYPVGQVLFLRFFIGFIPIFFIIPKDKIFTFYKTSRPGLHAFRAISGALAIIALFYGLRELPLADVVSLTFAGPIFVTVASIFFLSETVGIKRWFAVFLGFIGMSMAFESAKTTIKNYRTTSAIRTKLHQHSWIHGLPFKLRFHRSKLYISAIPPILIGFFVGVLSAMMGVGGGFIMIPAMVYILGMSTNVVVGTSLFQIIFVTANSTFFQSYLNQTVDIVLSALMILGGVIGAQIGVRIGTKLKAEYLRGILAILVLLVCAKILTDLILTPSDLFSTSLI